MEMSANKTRSLAHNGSDIEKTSANDNEENGRMIKRPQKYQLKLSWLKGFTRKNCCKGKFVMSWHDGPGDSVFYSQDFERNISSLELLLNPPIEFFVLIHDITNELHQQRSSCACSNRNYPSSE